MSIFDLPGPEFLQFYIVLLIIGIFVGVIWRLSVRGKFSPSPAVPHDLDVFEVAYLAGRKIGLGHAVLASLVHREIASVSSNGTIRLVAADPSTLFPFEQQFVAATMPGKSYTIKEIRNLINDAPLRQKLESRELSLSPRKELIATRIPAFIILSVLLVGMTKIGVGISRDKPVGFLVGLCILTVPAVIGFWRPAFRTAYGDRTLDDFRHDNEALQTSAKADAKVLSSDDVVLAFALWGPAILGGVALSPLRDALAAQAARNAYLGGGSGCGGSGCGGGGCGGGGCGGCGS